MIKSFLS